MGWRWGDDGWMRRWERSGGWHWGQALRLHLKERKTALAMGALPSVKFRERREHPDVGSTCARRTGPRWVCSWVQQPGVATAPRQRVVRACAWYHTDWGRGQNQRQAPRPTDIHGPRPQSVWYQAHARATRCRGAVATPGWCTQERAHRLHAWWGGWNTGPTAGWW